ncbi:MAG: spore germination protein GerW family protein [Oscillospiraceae bacterium]
MATEHPINDMLSVAMGKIKEMASSNTVIGDPITMPNGATAIPICRVSLGFASGGSDIPNKNNSDIFGGGTGGGVSITPIAFLVSTKTGDVKLMQLDTIGTTADNIVRAVPEVIDKVSGLFAGNKKKQEEI